MIKWFRTLLYIVRNYREERRWATASITRLELNMTALDKLVRERTDIAADVQSTRDGRSYAIMVGRYRDVDYVQTFDLDNSDLCAIIDQLRNMERHGRLRRVDAIPPIRAIVKRAVQV